MPAFHKQVRFAYQNTFHSPPTPAMTFASSAPSSTSQKRGRAPVFTGRVFPHRYLEMSGVTYDLMDPPSHITRNHHSISSRYLREPATNPPLPLLNITCPYLRWTITVYASNGSFVALGDVFDCIYRSLRTNITQQEFSSLPSQRDQIRATRAYEQRYRRLRSSREYDAEKRSGMKRVDFLMGHTRFLGIANSGRRPDEWLLHVT